MADNEYLITDKILHEYDKSLKKKISEIFISKNIHKLATDEISYIKTNYSSLSNLESTKEEVLQQLNDYKNVIVKYVMELPIIGDTKVCYILPVWKTWRPPTDMLDYDIPDPDYYELYYYINNEFELFGSTKVDYNNIVEIKDLPTKVSQLENDAKYVSESTQFTKLSQLENDSNYVTRASIPTKISSFNNDVGYITKSNLSTEYVTLNTNQNITSSKVFTKDVTFNAPVNINTLGSSSNRCNKAYVNDLQVTTINGSDISNFGSSSSVEVPTKLSDLDNDRGFITREDIPTVPTKLSQLENDTGFLTESVSSNGLFEVYEEYLDPFIIQVSKTYELDESLQGETDEWTLGNIDKVKFKSIEDVLLRLNIYTYAHYNEYEDNIVDIIERCNFTYIGDNDANWYFAMPFRSVSTMLWINAYRCEPTAVKLSCSGSASAYFSSIKISQKIMEKFQTKIIVEDLVDEWDNPLYNDVNTLSINFVVSHKSNGQIKFNFIKPKYGYIL